MTENRKQRTDGGFWGYSENYPPRLNMKKGLTPVKQLIRFNRAGWAGGIFHGITLRIVRNGFLFLLNSFRQD
jgi:hypothetical protein